MANTNRLTGKEDMFNSHTNLGKLPISEKRFDLFFFIFILGFSAIFYIRTVRRRLEYFIFFIRKLLLKFRLVTFLK